MCWPTALRRAGVGPTRSFPVDSVLARLHVCLATLAVLRGICFAEMRKHCFPNSFNVTCARDEVIVMTAARYGRMSKGQCLTSDYQVGCWADVLHHVDRKCSGRRHCVITIPDTVLHNLHPCQKDLFAYLESDHICQKVQTRPVFPPCQHVGKLEVVAPAGGPRYLASSVTEERSFGSSRCPWTVVAPRGRRLNFTLLDFAVVARPPTAGAVDVCRVYARIRQLPPSAQTGTGSTAAATGSRGSGGEVTVCAGRVRERPVFVSETERVQVTIVTSSRANEEDPAYFLLKYSAIGCADPEVPRGAWMQRDGDKATVACNFTTQTWHIVCQHDAWFGSVDNCTVESVDIKSSTLSVERAADPTLPFSLLVAVTIGLLLGVVLGVILLALVISCHKRLRRLKSLSESRAIYGDASHCRVPSTGQRETSHLCQYDSSSAYSYHHHHSPAAAPGAGLYRYTHVCAAGGQPSPSGAILYAPSSTMGGGGRGCEEQLLQPA